MKTFSLTYRVTSGTGALGPDASRFPYRRAKNCLGDEGLVLQLFALFEPCSMSAVVSADITDDVFSAVDCNISSLVYRRIYITTSWQFPLSFDQFSYLLMVNSLYESHVSKTRFSSSFTEARNPYECIYIYTQFLPHRKHTASTLWKRTDRRNSPCLF